MPDDLDRAAELTIWPRALSAPTAEGRSYPTVREALKGASEAHSQADVQTWIITEAGEIPAPSFIDA